MADAGGRPARVLVTGAAGQIGTELVPALRARYGAGNVVAGLRNSAAPPSFGGGPAAQVDVTDRASIAAAVRHHRCDTIVHLAGVLSARGEGDPGLAWAVNVDGTRNVLEVARTLGVPRVFVPSSIAVFGANCPRDATPQDTILQPATMYGVTKVTGELLGEYYVKRYGLQVRGLRLPGIISSEALPGGGTTDYAVEIFHAAVAGREFTCFLEPDTALPMLYMPDCLEAIIGVMEAEPARLQHHTGFNVTGFSVTPAQLAAAICRHLPGFTIRYVPDFRQAIADSWPRSLDDRAARAEWGWRPAYDLETMTADMIRRLKARVG